MCSSLVVHRQDARTTAVSRGRFLINFRSSLFDWKDSRLRGLPKFLYLVLVSLEFTVFFPLTKFLARYAGFRR